MLVRSLCLLSSHSSFSFSSLAFFLFAMLSLFSIEPYSFFYWVSFLLLCSLISISCSLSILLICILCSSPKFHNQFHMLICYSIILLSIFICNLLFKSIENRYNITLNLIYGITVNYTNTQAQTCIGARSGSSQLLFNYM